MTILREQGRDLIVDPRSSLWDLRKGAERTECGLRLVQADKNRLSVKQFGGVDPNHIEPIKAGRHSSKSKDRSMGAMQNGPTVMDDKNLRQNIIDELDWVPTVNAAHIGVAVDKGVATLTGHVPSYSQLIAAEAAVKRVKGVQAIAQEMEVRFAGTAAQSDEDVASRAVSLLKWTSSSPSHPIQVKVSKGWISLTGEVEWQFQRHAAENNLRDLIGVKGVSNLITVKPLATATDVVSGIENALKRDARFEADGIKVSVDNGKVRLEGRVHSWHERDAVERAAWAAPGVRAVEDHVSIN